MHTHSCMIHFLTCLQFIQSSIVYIGTDCFALIIRSSCVQIDPCMDIPIWLELFLLATTQNKQYILTSQHQYMDFSCSWKTIPSFRRHNLPSYYTTGELGSSRQALVLSLRAGSHEPCSLTSPTQAPISSASFMAPTAVLYSDSCTFLVFPLSEPPAAKVGTVSKQEYTISIH